MKGPTLSRPASELAYLSVAVLANDKGELPTEFRLFAKGDNATTKGVVVFDAAAAKSVMQCAQEKGVQLMIDYQHASLSSLLLMPSEQAKAAGWFTPEVRDDELWATSVEWTPEGSAKVKAKEFRYVSPAFDYTKLPDEKIRVAALINVALTNLPATHNATALLSAAESPMEGWVPMCLGRSCSTGSLCCQACSSKVLCASLCYGSTVPPDPSGTVTMSSLQTSAREAGDAWEKSLTAKATAAALKEHSMKTVIAHLKLSETATEAEVFAALVRRDEEHTRQLSALTTEKEKLSAQAVELAAKVATMEQATTKAELSSLVDQGKRDGKISPALEEVVKTFTLSQLKAFLEKAPVIVKPGPGVREPTAPTEGGPMTLSAETEHVAKALRLDPKKVVEHAAKHGGVIP